MQGARIIRKILRPPGKNGRHRPHCCKVEAVVNVDDRGQLILPKDIRTKLNIESGSKITLISFEKGGELCCVTMIKADRFTSLVKDLLGPLMKEFIG